MYFVTYCKLPHITNLTGQIMPVREIVDFARPRGIEVLVDGAHAFAHFPFTRDELGVDYYGTSLHKWLLAPDRHRLPVREEGKAEDALAADGRGGDVRTTTSGSTRRSARIRRRITTRSRRRSRFIAASAAERKIARLRIPARSLGEAAAGRESAGEGADAARQSKYSGAIALFSVDGLDFGKLGAWLMAKHRIVNTPIVHPEFNGIRITPNVYTTVDEIDTFADKMIEAMKKGIS